MKSIRHTPLDSSRHPEPPSQVAQSDRGSALLQVRAGDSRRMLLDTRSAFDSVARAYDGPLGNNPLIRRMRRTMWDAIETTFSPGERLVDLGCGTGLDAAYLARGGYRILAIDSSPEMVARTRARIASEGLEQRVAVRQLGMEDIASLVSSGEESFGGMYSNLGAMNCLPEISSLAHHCARVLRPHGRLIVSVIGRYCPWEIASYLLMGNRKRAFVRFRRGMVPVPLNGATVWTRYYSPRSFYREFEKYFALTSYRALSLFAPPPYLIRLHDRAAQLCESLARLDDRTGGWPLLRSAGDHFLMTLTRSD